MSCARDLAGLARLAADATVGTSDVAEALHAQIGLRLAARGDRRRGISGIVYRNVRRIARLAGRGTEAALLRLARDAREAPPSPRRDALVAALNGVVGDGLDAIGNPLAIEMGLWRHGAPLDPRTLVGASPHVLVLIHGLCMTDAQWTAADGHDHGAALERDAGLTAVYLRYNTGLHISANGREVSDVLERLVAEWPVPAESLSLLCHSMGGLVARSAAHVGAGRAWTRVLRRIVFLGTPHAGSPLERGGNRLDRLFPMSRFSAPFARVGQIRSAGITDLRHGALLDADWQGRDRFETRVVPQAVPLPPGVAAFAIAATAGKRAGGITGRIIGDGLVPESSALGDSLGAARALGIPEVRRHVAAGVHHFGLLGAAVYPTVRQWIARDMDEVPAVR